MCASPRRPRCLSKPQDSRARTPPRIRAVVQAGGYHRRSTSEFDRSHCLFPRDVTDFIIASQPKNWKRLQDLRGADYKERFLDHLALQLKRRGVVDARRNGLKDHGIKFHLAYFRPAIYINEKAARIHKANLFTVIRQLHYSPKSEHSLDLTIVLEETDPNLLYEIERQLLDFGVFAEPDMSALALVFFDPKTTHDQYYAAQWECVDRFTELDPESRTRFQQRLRDYRRLYGFLSQVMPFTDTDSEKLNAFVRCLATLLQSYVVGLGRNPRLQRTIEAEMEASRKQCESSGEPARHFRSFPNRTLKSWSRERRVVAKAEYLPGL